MLGLLLLSLAGPVAATLLMGGYGGGEVEDPPIPSMLVKQDEPSFGEFVSSRIDWALQAATERLEPRWGSFETELYSVTAADVSHLQDAIAEALPPGWMPVEVSKFPPGRGVLFAYAFKSRVFAVLTVEPKAATDFPVVVLTSVASH